jgi:hypothetical protein
MKLMLRSIGWGMAVVIALAVVYSRIATTFDVTAETEWVEFVPGPQPRSDWMLEEARVFVGADTVGRIITGSLKLSDSAKVVVQRRSMGPLTLDISSLGTDPHVGEIALSDSGTLSLGSHAIILVEDLEARSQKGTPVVLPVKGSLIAGRTIEIETDPSPARFRSGKVTSFGRSIFGWTVFPAGTVELTSGDHVSLEMPRSPAFGLIVADERPALSVGYRGIAKAVKVRRPGGSDYRIGTTIYHRIAADQTLQALIVTLGFLFELTRRFRGRRREERQSAEIKA